ncbi:hypothetical protein Lesp02_46690 [Lentzea sp. NBRC 105346]|nr:hypothetical protein Lesp02_46690 [Lentzea sp. NBRC 105346]
MLLLLDGETGRVLAGSTEIENGLGGAVLLDLVNAGRVGFGPDGRRLEVIDPTPLDNPLLYHGLSRLDRAMKPQRAVERLRKNVRDNVMRQLADRGVLRLEKRRILGIFPSTGWVIVDENPGQDIRNRVGAVLYGQQEPDERTGALIALLYAMKAAHKVVGGDSRAIKARAKEISRGNWAGAAVKGAMDAVQAAVIASITAAVVASTSTASSS